MTAAAPQRARTTRNGAARRRRLTGIGTFDTLLRTGRRRDGEFLQLVWAPARDGAGRSGFIIGRKALPLAVDRNRLRRLLRVAIAGARPASDDYDMILRLTRRVARGELDAVAADARRLLGTLSAPGPSR